jgi:mannose/fructose/N-acetylgalactosamine-specific phosphotransferase system component IIC
VYFIPVYLLIMKSSNSRITILVAAVPKRLSIKLQINQNIVVSVQDAILLSPKTTHNSFEDSHNEKGMKGPCAL